MVKEIIVHEVPVALVMFSGKANIFIHIECYYILECNFACLVHFDKSLVNAKGRRTCGKTKNKGAVFFVVVDCISNMLSSPLTHSVIVVSDNKFHFYASPILNLREIIFL